jgi:pyruvate,water dikinase
MEQPLRHIIGVHGARMYYNLSSIHAVLRSAPFGDLLTASFNQFVGAGEVADRDVDGSFAARARGRVAQGGELAVIAFKTARQYCFLTRRVERFEATATRFAARTHPDRLASRPLSELLDDFRAFLDIRFNRWNDAALADAASMVCYGVLQRLLARALPEADQSSLHNTLLKALPNLVSGIPALKLWDLSREIRADERLSRLFASSPPEQVLPALSSERFAAFNTAFRRYLDEWGFRCSAELMLTTPSFQETPAAVIELLKAYAAIDGPSPGEQLRRQESERLAETARVRRAVRSRGLLAFVVLGPAVSLVLAWTQRAIQLRERARLKQALLYSRLRRIALAIGARLVESGRLADRDDVFFLTADEIDALLSGHAMFPDHVRGLVELRRQAHRELSAAAPPDSMRLAAGEYIVGSTDAPDVKVRPATLDAVLSGVGACGGTVTGRAVVLAGVGESEKIAPGDVLITRQTDPGWGPIFPLISGLVIERGGMLSHGAIIAREFGIPSVVGVRDATRHVADGSRITVDGDRGLVHLHVEAQPC